MNAHMDYDEQSADYKVSYRPAQQRSSQTAAPSGRPIGRRRGKAPVQFNGMHRRRTKKIRW